MVRRILPFTLLAAVVLVSGVAQAKGKLRITTRALKRAPVTFRVNGKPHYTVRLRLKGPRRQMKKIAQVTYELHRVYKQPLRTTRDKLSKFGVDIKSYGYFPVRAHITHTDGSKKTIAGYLKFDPRKAQPRAKTAKPSKQPPRTRGLRGALRKVDGYLSGLYASFGREPKL